MKSRIAKQKDQELFFGIIGHVGDLKEYVKTALKTELSDSVYSVEPIKISVLLKFLDGLSAEIKDDDANLRINP